MNRTDTTAHGQKPVVCVALYSFEVGGSETLGAALIRHYLDCGLDVVCVSTRRSTGPLQKRIEAFGVDCLAMGLEEYSRIVRPFRRRRLVSWLRERKVTVVHAHHLSVFADVLRAAIRAGVRRTIVTEHSLSPALKRRRYRRFVRRLMRRATVCTAINTVVQEALVNASGLPATSVPVIENGVDTDLFLPVEKEERSGSVTIGWVGRLHPEKDVLNALRGFELAAGRCPNGLRLLIAGDGQERDLAQEFVEKAKLKGRVEFLGSVSDVVSVLHRCDLFLLSSRKEGTPLALLEAMSCGLPVVATAVGGIPVSVQPETARLVPAEDPESLAEAIATLAAQPELRRRMGAAARELVLQRFSDREMKNRYAQLVMGLAGAG